MTLDMEQGEPTSDGNGNNSNPPPTPIPGVNTNGNAAGTIRSEKQPLKVCVATQPHVLLQRNSLSPSGPTPRKIMSKNNNNTMFPTSYPNNLAELQLFRVMQNASLLLYYDTLLEMGGDDVQQLCDAGEEEFLEIMSLVGMASKPLHVRRLQKSLQEWVTNPVKFKVPLVPGEDFEVELSSPRVTSNHVFYAETADATRTMYSSSPGDLCALPPVSSPGLTFTNKRPYSPMDPSCPPSSSSSPGPTLPSVQLSPCLMESQIAKLAAAAERLSKQLPQFEPKPHNAKKKVCKELELVMSMAENDPRRMDEIRRYAAIYGRFDCKRKPEKPLTLHEVSVNEAAAQICRFIPALLTRRDELFPLARQVVKDSGCYYSKTQLSTVYVNKTIGMNQDSRDGDNNISARGSPRILDNDGPLVKRQKLDSNSDGDDLRQDYDDGVVIRSSLHSLFQQNLKNQSIIRGNISRRSSVGVEVDESDSQFTFSSSSSPQRKQEDLHDIEDDGSKYSPKVQIIAASGDNIIAVANPALAMSPAIIPPLTTIIEARESRTEVD